METMRSHNQYAIMLQFSHLTRVKQFYYIRKISKKIIVPKKYNFSYLNVTQAVANEIRGGVENGNGGQEDTNC